MLTRAKKNSIEKQRGLNLRVPKECLDESSRSEGSKVESVPGEVEEKGGKASAKDDAENQGEGRRGSSLRAVMKRHGRKGLSVLLMGRSFQVFRSET